MTIMQEKETRDKRNATISLLSLLFPSHSVIFTPRSMSLSGETSSITFDENNFEDFQEIIKLIFCVSNKNNQ